MTGRPPAVAATADAGRAARSRAPRKGLAAWDHAAREVTALDRLRAQESVRDATLLPLRYARMASSPWAYLRGAAAVMAADLATRPHSGLEAQMCGDAHILNFGLWASPERQLLFNVRDFDETLGGPFEWDLLRLTTSCFVLADANGLSRSVGEAGARAAAEGYVEAMRRYSRMGELDVWYDVITAADAMEHLADEHVARVEKRIRTQSEKRTQEAAVRRLTTVVDGRRRLVEDPPRRRHLTDSEADQAQTSRDVFATYVASQPAHLRRLIERFRRVDTVQQVVGVGSVGMRVWLHLVEGDSGRQPLLFQVKQATASVYEEHLAPSPYAHGGERVCVGARLMQSASDTFLGHTHVDGLDYYVRQLRDLKIIPEGERVVSFLSDFARACGHALAKSHARSGEPTAIAAYIGKGGSFTDGVVGFGRAYAAQTVEDHAALVAAVAAGTLEVAAHPW